MYICMRQHILQYTTMIVIAIMDGLHHIEEALVKVVLLGPEQDVFCNTSAFQLCGRPQSEHQGTLETDQYWVVTGKLKVCFPSPPDLATTAQHRHVACDKFQRQGPNVDPETIIIIIVIALIVIETFFK